MDNYVILSTALLLEDGDFSMKSLSKEEALEWVLTHSPKNFCGHQTVKVLGLEPAKTRESCFGYTEALCLRPEARLEFGKEYSIEEISSIGVFFQLISKG